MHQQPFHWLAAVPAGALEEAGMHPPGFVAEWRGETHWLQVTLCCQEEALDASATAFHTPVATISCELSRTCIHHSVKLGYASLHVGCPLEMVGGLASGTCPEALLSWRSGQETRWAA